ncbi:MAG: porin family protein [Bacteroidales bacterium]
MKKAALVLILGGVLFTLNARAQQKPFVFGFRFAPNVGWNKSETKEYNRDGMQPGFSWGFVAEFYLMENYAITTGFDIVYLYTRMSYPHEVQIDNSTSPEGILNRKYKLKYIEIPLILKMRTNEFGKFRFYGQVGLGTSFLLGAKADDEFSYGTEKITEEKVDIYDDVGFIRESLIIGAGTEFMVSGSTVINLGVKFDNGFLNILNDNNPARPGLEPKAINNYLELNLGVVF